MSKLNFTVLYKGNVYGYSITLNGANIIIGNLIKNEQYKFEDFEIVDYVGRSLFFKINFISLSHNNYKNNNIMNAFIGFIIAFIFMVTFLIVVLKQIFKEQPKSTNREHNIKVGLWFVLVAMTVFLLYNIGTSAYYAG